MKDNFNLDKLRKPKKKRINSRKKGNTFENKICKLLNDRFETNEFCRTPGSGAFATTHSLPEHMKVYGDLITPLNFKFVVDCKKGYNEEALSTIFNEKSKFWEFVEQVERDAKKAGRLPLLIWQQDRKNILAAFPSSEFGEQGLNNKINIQIFNKSWTIILLDNIINLNNYYWFNN